MDKIETKMKNNTRTYDLRALEEQMMGDKDIVKSVVEMFIMSVPAELELMQASFEGNDMVSIGKIAHKLKSNVNMLNIAALKEDVRTLEKAPEMEKEEVQPLLDNFISTMHTTIKQLQEDIDKGMLD